MKGRSIVIFIIVGILGVLSTGVGLLFEFIPDKTLVNLFDFSWNNDDYCTGMHCVHCEYFLSPAFYLVVAAVTSVVVVQIIISVSTDCACCSGRRSFSSDLHTLAIVTFFFSWLASIAAISVYIIGGAKQYGVQFPEFGHLFSSLGSIWADNSRCYKVKDGIFGAASAFSFCAVILGVITYLTILFGEDYRRKLPNQGNVCSSIGKPVDIAFPEMVMTIDIRYHRTNVHWPVSEA